LGEEDVIRIYKYRLSQRVLLTALASIKAPLQCNNSESVTDYKLNVNRNALDSVGDDRTALYACKRHEVRVHHCLQLGNLIFISSLWLANHGWQSQESTWCSFNE
jgi:hypothetical protein